MRDHIVFSLIACLAALVTSANGESRPAQYTAIQLQMRLANTNAKIVGFHIIYDAVAATNASADGPVYVHRELAAHGPSQFMHWSAKSTPTYTAVQDPLQQRLIINGEAATIEYPADRAFVRSSTNGHLPGSAPREIMFLALGWWPLTAISAPQLVPGTAVVFPDIANSHDYRVRSEQSLVGDRWCHVLENPNHDRLWLDASRGCTIMAREIIDPQSGYVAQRIEGSNPREVAAGVWAPQTFRNFLFDPANHQLRVDSQLFIRAITLNEDAVAGEFNFNPSPGSIELKSGRFEQTTPGGFDFLDETASRLKQFHRYSAAPPSFDCRKMIASLALGLLITLGATMTLRAMTHSTTVLSKGGSRAD